MENRGGQSAAHGQTPVQHVLKGLVIQPELSDVSLPMCQLFSHREWLCHDFFAGTTVSGEAQQNFRNGHNRLSW